MKIELSIREIGSIISALECEYDYCACSVSAEFLIKMIKHKMESIGPDDELYSLYIKKLNYYTDEYNHHCELEKDCIKIYEGEKDTQDYQDRLI